MLSLAKEINKIAVNDGSADAQDFVIAFILQGNGVMDFVDFLASEHKLYYSYSAVYRVIRPLIPSDIFGLRHIFKLNVLAKKAGYISVVEMFESFDRKPKILIAKTLGCSVSAVGRFAQKYNIERSTVRKAFAPLRRYRKVDDGFKRLPSMLKWERQAKALGFKTVRQAIVKLKRVEKLTNKQIAGLFCVSRQAFWVRKKAMGLK